MFMHVLHFVIVKADNKDIVSMPVVLNLTCLYCIYHDSAFSICTSSFLQDFCMSEELMKKMK